MTCTGGELARPPIDGIDGPHVVWAVDLLRRPALADGAGPVVVVGGGAVGCETAFWLAAEHARQVTVVEMLPQLMTGNCTANRGYLLHYLEARGVRLLNCARLQSIDDEGSRSCATSRPRFPTPTSPGRRCCRPTSGILWPARCAWSTPEETIAAELVVLATGLVPASGLHEECVRRHVAPELYNVGDSFSVGRVFDAVRAGSSWAARCRGLPGRPSPCYAARWRPSCAWAMSAPRSTSIRPRLARRCRLRRSGYRPAGGASRGAGATSPDAGLEGSLEGELGGWPKEDRRGPRVARRAARSRATRCRRRPGCGRTRGRAPRGSVAGSSPAAFSSRPPPVAAAPPGRATGVRPLCASCPGRAPRRAPPRRSRECP